MGYTAEEANDKLCMLLLIAVQLRSLGAPPKEGELEPSVNCIDKKCMHWVITNRGKEEGRCGFVYLKPQFPTITVPTPTVE
jgi:hypothetical protein